MTLYLIHDHRSYSIHEDDLNSQNRMPCIFHNGSNSNLYISPPNGDGEAGFYKCHSAKCGISGGVLDEFQERK